MPSILTVLLSITVLALGVIYQAYVAPFLKLGGVYRIIEPLNIENCVNVEGIDLSCSTFHGININKFLDLERT